MVKKYPIVAGLIILLVLLTSFWYLKSPTNTPNPDLKTYRNDKYGFEFKYPKSFTVHDVGAETRRSTPQLWGLYLTNTKVNNPQSIRVNLTLRSTGSISVENLQYNYQEWMPGESVIILNRAKIKVDDQDGIEEKIYNERNPSIPNSWVHLIHNNKLYTLEFLVTTSTPSVDIEIKSIKKSILDSFRFIK